jgi:hypothetical protein
LVEIVGCDPGLVYSPYVWYSGPGLVVLFKQQNPPNMFSNRILELVNSPNFIVIYGTQGDYPHTGTDGKTAQLWETGGGVTDHFGNDNSCKVYVDVDDANHQGYLDIDITNEGTFNVPLCLILYHELSHAYHESIKHDAPTTKQDIERQVRQDTNYFNPTIGLPLESITDYDNPHYGQPTNEVKYTPCKDTRTPWQLCVCNIATAALGSPAARPIAEFRRAKREFERLTLGSVPVLEPMMTSYQLFSPLVAGDMRTDSALREAMLHFAVQPALHLLRIVRSYIADASDDAAVDAQADLSVSQYLAKLPNDAVMRAGVMAVAARDAAAILASGIHTNWADTRTLADDVFAAVVRSVFSTGADGRGPAWILDGIALFLDAAARRDSQLLASAVAEWLAFVPLPPQASLHDVDDLTEELARLRTTLFHHPASYEVFARRVEATWPRAGAPVNALTTP